MHWEEFIHTLRNANCFNHWIKSFQILVQFLCDIFTTNESGLILHTFLSEDRRVLKIYSNHRQQSSSAYWELTSAERRQCVVTWNLQCSSISTMTGVHQFLRLTFVNQRSGYIARQSYSGRFLKMRLVESDVGPSLALSSSQPLGDPLGLFLPSIRAKCERAWRREATDFTNEMWEGIDGGRERETKDASEGAKKRCSWDSLPPHYSVCSSISRREMAKARAPLFLWVFDNPRRYRVDARLGAAPRRVAPSVMYADSRGYHLSVASQLPLLCHLAFVYRVSSAREPREILCRARAAATNLCMHTICSVGQNVHSNNRLIHRCISSYHTHAYTHEEI